MQSTELVHMHLLIISFSRVMQRRHQGHTMLNNFTYDNMEGF